MTTSPHTQSPQSKESEMMVLGCMLSSINALNVGADSLSPMDFYYPEHKIIFEVLQTAYRQDKPSDLLLTTEELKRQDKLQAVGGVNYLNSLIGYAGTAAYIEEYCEVIKAKAVLRRMISTCKEIEKTAIEEPDDVYATLDEAQAKFFSISQSSASATWIHIKDILAGSKSEAKVPFLKELQDKQEKFKIHGKEEEVLSGIPSLFIDLDKMLGGLGKSNLMILAARPAMGKTALALNIAENVCFKLGMPVGIFSLEMTADQLVHRLICSQSEVESHKIKQGSLSGHEYQRIVSAVHTMQKGNMVIDDHPGLKISDIRVRARRMKEAHKIELLIIDYLQLISGGNSKGSTDNRQNEISEISRMLKTLARELNVPIVCLSQLSRKVEERPGHRPMMSDLRESGSIEQDADCVMFLLRQEYYDPYNKPGQAELIVAKNRHGGVGSVNLTYRKEITQFANFVGQPTPEAPQKNTKADAFSAFSPR
jgi:replicative DNA helicase